MDDVLVIGAGPTGLALACGLRAHGVPVRIVDGATGPARTSRALGLHARGAEVLDRLGALGDLPARGVPLRRVAVSIGGREVGCLDVGRQTKLVQRPGVLASQALLEGALRERLVELGTTVEWGREVAKVATTGTVGFADGEVVGAGWVVGCDGAHSRVRKAAGFGFPGVPLVERFLLADVHVTLPTPRDTVSVWLDGEDMLAAFPLPGEHLWRLMAPGPDADLDPLPALAAMLERHAGVPATAIGEVEWTSTFRFHRRLADTYRRGRVLLAGDAAHIHSPFGGQGLNTGIGDAENLAWKVALVADGRAGADLLDTYEAERRPIAEEVLASTSGMTRMVLGGSIAARLVRDHVFVPLMNRQLVQRVIWERSSQLRISYRGGPLARRRLGRPQQGRPRPGDRVADIDCSRDGAPTRLHAELGGCWAVVAPDPNLAVSCAAAATDRLGAGHVVVLDAVAGRPWKALLVRPDGHLAWRGTDPADLRRWLATSLPAASPPTAAGDPDARSTTADNAASDRPAPNSTAPGRPAR